MRGISIQYMSPVRLYATAPGGKGGGAGAAVAATRQQDSNVLVSVGHLAVNLSADSRKVTP